MRVKWWLLLLVAPAAAFVFVPNRGPTSQRATVLTGTLVQAGDDGTLLNVGESSVALSNRRGDDLGVWRAPDGYTLERPVLLGRALAVFVARRAGAPASVTAFRLALDQSQPLWTKEFPDLAEQGVRVAAGARPPVVAVVAGGAVELFEAASGQSRSRRVLGSVVGPVCWARDSGFARTATAVVGFDAALPTEPFAWSWPVPAGEALERLEWQDGGAVLVAYGRQRAYVLGN